ncbi:MAG: helix-turn-helix transcriptional regulator [Firmicutes bacterium]|nr:helix-turn-helix transcriptional regulator [Bacillota bacterium]
MQVEKSSFFSSILGLLHSKDNINIRNVRIERLPYMLIFPLAPVFANMQGALFSEAVHLFGLNAMTLMGSAYCVGAGMLFALTSVKNMARVSRIFALATVISFIPWMVMEESPFSLMLAILFMLGLGGCAACASFAYTFALNNAERLLGAAMISLFFALNQLDSGLSFISGIFNKTYLTLLVAGTFICLFFYKTGDFDDALNRPEATLNPPLKLMLYFFVAHYFVEIFYTYLPGSSSTSAMIANGVVGILVVCLAVTLQFLTKSSIWNMCNLFFVAIICTYLLHFMPEGSFWRSAARFTHGFEQMGYIAAYYLLGCVFKKHGDFRLFKLCLVTILPVSMISYLLPGALASHAPDLLPLAATITSGAVFIVFILMSPAYAKHLFHARWSDDFYNIDMSEDAQQVGQVKQFDLVERQNLTPREKEVAALLLNGKAAKEIAWELKISVHTANFHIKNIYKKLNISSRSELFALFSSTISSFNL